MRAQEYLKKIKMIKKYRRRNRLKEIEARSYAAKARMNHEKLLAKKNSPPE